MIIAYALFVTFMLGLLIGSCVTIMAAFNSEGDYMDSEAVRNLITGSRERAEARSTTILSYEK